MNKLLFLVCLFASLCANGQEPGFFYFDKSDRLVVNQEDASKRKEIRPVSDKQFEIIEAVKTSTGWTENGKKEVVNYKKDKFKITRDIYGTGINTSISVIDTLAEGFLIREYFEGFCFREAEVKSVFPLVLHGKCTSFPKTRNDQIFVSYYWNDLKYTEAEQTPGIDSIFTVSSKKPDVYPQYPGGSNQYFNDIISLFGKKKYGAKELSGLAWISVTVDTTGKTGNIRVIKSIHPEVDSLLVNSILAADTPWIPAGINGESIDFEYYIPFQFIQKEKTAQSATEKIHLAVEKMPEYIGGEQALKRVIASNIR